MLHTSRQMFQHQEKLALRKTIRILGIVQDVEETTAGAELHDNHLTSAILLLLDRQQFDDVLVFDLFEDLELPHLYVVRAHVTELIKSLDRDGFPIVFVDTLEHRAGRALAKHAGGAPNVVGGATKEGHVVRVPFLDIDKQLSLSVRYLDIRQLDQSPIYKLDDIIWDAADLFALF